MRLNTLASWIISLLFVSLLPAAPLLAASYSENFDDGQAQGWSSSAGGWAVNASGDYRSSDDQTQYGVSTYDGTTWGTDFTFTARMYIEHAASGNRGAVVIGYQSASDYYQVWVNPVGGVGLDHVTNPTVTSLATGTTTAVGQRTWFDVKVVVAASKVSAWVNGQQALTNVTVPGLAAGRAGVSSIFNWVHVDDVQIQNNDYLENFDDGQAQSWSSSAGGWAVSASGDYESSDDQTQYGVSTYDGVTWGTDFTYTARMYIEHAASGNRGALVFGYQSASDYYQVWVNPVGGVGLDHVTNPTVTPLATGTSTAVGQRTWFNVKVVVAASKLSAWVNGELALSNIPVTGLLAGRAGVSSIFNHVRVDDIEIQASSTQANNATLLFKSGYEGAVIGSPYDCTTSPPGNCWQEISGTDSNTGFTWPLSIWGATGHYQLVTVDNVTNAAASSSILNEIRDVTGHTGATTKALYQALLKQPTATSPTHQDPFIVNSIPGTNPQGDIYIREWFKLPDVANNVEEWRVLWQWKTGGDYRVSLNIENYSQPGLPAGTPYWILRGDNDANSTDPNWHLQTFFEHMDTTHPVPNNQWFKLEVFWHRGQQGDTNGRVWVAINGQQIFDHQGSLWGVDNAMINRIMVHQLYTRAEATQYVDDVEIWDGFPADASAH